VAASQSGKAAEVGGESGTAAPGSDGIAQVVAVPDIGTDEAVELIEICVAAGDRVQEGDSIVVLESDKASMEVPAPFAGEVSEILVAVGDSVRQGSELLRLVGSVPDRAAPPTGEPPAAASPPPPAASQPAASASPSSAGQPAPVPATTVTAGEGVYAGPAVRKLARELGVDLAKVSGTGPRGRIQKEDLHGFVQQALTGRAAATAGAAGIPPVPAVDFAAFGEVDVQPLTRMEKLTAANMWRSWLNVPHVTQFDDADITELEAFRAALKTEAQERGVRLTPLPFLLKACAVALRDNPRFSASLGADGESLVYKKYCHIGMAVDTPAGLLVPVIRDVDRKTLWELAAEVIELAARARERKLSPADMQGGCFTISSLGNIGGTGFTPIVNAPEVGILGVSRASTQPVWDGTEFRPRTMLPLALSYDHRVINGGDAGRFMTRLVELLGDIRRLLL
jgi:pyruvate dehydrogenase E2 component (dihydrolipoamide acetyltransferase)